MLVNEADLWPDGQFVTTHLIVGDRVPRGAPGRRQEPHHRARPGDRRGQRRRRRRRRQSPTTASRTVTTSRLADETIAGAWENLEFTLDPIASSLQGSADDAIAVGLLDPVELDGIYDLTLLNEVLAERGDAEVDERIVTRRRSGSARRRQDVRVGQRRGHRAARRRPRRRATGEFVCLIGASGCGKSTILNLVAGLDQPSAGTVDVDGRTALMFQEAALFPWLTVAANVELPMRLAGVPKAERRARAEQLLGAVHLDGFAKKRPAPAVRAACASAARWPGRSPRTPRSC